MTTDLIAGAILVLQPRRRSWSSRRQGGRQGILLTPRRRWGGANERRGATDGVVIRIGSAFRTSIVRSK